jgi:hypothetical protein
MHGDGVRISGQVIGRGVAPDLGEQLRARQDDVTMLRQVDEQIEQ